MCLDNFLTIHRNPCRRALDPRAGRSLCILYLYELLTGLKKTHARSSWTASWANLYSHLKSDDTKCLCATVSFRTVEVRFPANAKAVISRLYVILCVCVSEMHYLHSENVWVVFVSAQRHIIPVEFLNLFLHLLLLKIKQQCELLGIVFQVKRLLQ